MGNQVIGFVFTLLFIGVFSKSTRIIGGQQADIREFPFIASIRFFPTNLHLCGGVIISNKHILTAAHCVYDYKFDWSNLKVFVGSSTLSKVQGTAVFVEKITYHPKYKATKVGYLQYENDLAVLKVKGNIQFNIQQAPVKLPTKDVAIGSNALVCGWGPTSYPRGKYSYNLLKGTIKVLSAKDCVKEFPFPVLNDQICTYTKGTSIINGDEGGPVIVGGELVGIVSYNIKYFSAAGDIHSNVYKHMDFVRNALRT